MSIRNTYYIKSKISICSLIIKNRLNKLVKNRYYVSINILKFITLLKIYFKIIYINLFIALNHLYFIATKHNFVR